MHHTPEPGQVLRDAARCLATPEEADAVPLSCKECGTKKESVKSLKTHIKMVHLRAGKFR